MKRNLKRGLSDNIHSGWANFFCETPVNISLCRPYDPPHNASTLSLQCKSNQRQQGNEWAWMSSSKTLRTKQIEVCIWPVGHSLLTADLGEKFDKVWKKKRLSQNISSHKRYWLSTLSIKNIKFSPGWCGSVDWVPACKPKGSIPSQGTHLGCGPGPQQGAHERQPHIDVCLPLFLPPFPLSKNK